MPNEVNPEYIEKAEDSLEENLSKAEVPFVDENESAESGEAPVSEDESVSEGESIPEDTPAPDGMPEATDAPSENESEPSQRRVRHSDMLRQRREQNEDRERINANRQAFLTGWEALNQARSREDILYAPVVSVDVRALGERENNTQSRQVFLILLAMNRYKIMIPFQEIYRDDPIDPSVSGEITARQRQMASKLLGSDIPFVVTGLFAGREPDFSDYVCSGSRKRAIEILENRNYRGSRRTGPRLAEGSRCTATIVSVGPYAVTANVGGVDTQIPLRDMTFRYVTDLRDEFAPGDKVDVIIRSVKDQDGKIRVTASGREVEVEDSKIRRNFIAPGSYVVGIVTNVGHDRPDSEDDRINAFFTGEASDAAGRTRIHAQITPLNLPARVFGMRASALFNELRAGDEIKMRVLGIRDDGYVNCGFVGVNGSPGVLLH